MHPNLFDSLNLLKSGQSVLFPRLGGGNILFEKKGYGKYRITWINTFGSKERSKDVNYKNLVEIFEKMK